MTRIGFGIEAETFITTGINCDRLWLHCNSRPAVDAPSRKKPCFYPYIGVTNALETCSTLADVELLLGRWERTRRMILFVVDGKSEKSAILECQCCEHRRRPTPDGPLIAANHSYRDALQNNTGGNNPEHGLERSISRCIHMEELLCALPKDIDARGLQRVLAADGVEQRYPDRVTVFSTVACPATGEMWFACGQRPAASTGTWSRVPWPWLRLLERGTLAKRSSPRWSRLWNPLLNPQADSD